MPNLLPASIFRSAADRVCNKNMPRIKNFIPEIFLRLYGKVKRKFYKTYYSIKFPGLIIRNSTSDWKAFKQVFILKEYDFSVGCEPKFIIDGGANVGYASLFFADKFPQAEIFAIEPEESNFEILKKNTVSHKQIKAIKAGLWYKKAYLKVADTDFGKWGFMTKEAGPDDYDIQAITINEILKQSGREEIDILKLDIEGAERELFSKNYDSWLGKVRVLIIELHDRMKEGCSDAFYLATKKYNFNYSQKGENIILIKK